MTHTHPRPKPGRIPRSLAFLALLGVLAGCRGGVGPEWPGPASTAEGPPFVEIQRLAGAAPMAGDRVAGAAGDWLLRNERLAVVVSGEAREGIEAGSLIDAAPGGGRDLLDAIDPRALWGSGASPRVTEVFHDAAADSAGRTLVVRAQAGDRGALQMETRITLSAGSNRLQLVTTVTNSGPEAVTLPGWIDGAEWGEAQLFVPGQRAGESPEAGSAPFVTAAGEGAAYAWVIPGASLRVGEGETSLRSSGAAPVVSSGGSATFTRVLIVCPGSWAEAADLAWGVRGEIPGRILIAAVDPEGAPVEGAVAEARDEAGRVWGRGVTSALGMSALPVPPGRYDLFLAHPHRRALDHKQVDVKAGGLERGSCRLSDPGRLRVAAFDERGRSLAARWTLTDLEPGGGRGSPADPALWASSRVFFSSAEGDEILVPPGKYGVRAARGSAHESWWEEIMLEPGRPRTLRAQLTALPIPAGWIAADLGSGPLSAGPPTAARLRALAGDGFALALGPPAGAQTGAATGDVALIPADAFVGAGVEILRIPLDGPRDEFEAAWKQWIERLAAGDEVAAVAGAGSSPAAAAPAGPGDARTFVGLIGSTEAAGTDDVVAAVSAGRVVVTRGPFIEFNLNGGETGARVEAEPGTVRGHLRVTASQETDVTEVAVYVNGDLHTVYRVRGDRPIRFDEDIELYLTEPALVIARVDGFVPRTAGSRNPEPPPESASIERDSQRTRPLAFTNPIRVAISDR